MRLLTMLATAVLLAACVHDTEDFDLFLVEKGVSLTYYIDTEDDSGQKGHDDPWDTIIDGFGLENVHTSKSGDEDPWNSIKALFNDETIYVGKSGEEDPWNRIKALFPSESVHTGKSDEQDPWNRINELFPAESVHRGKTDDRYFFGVEKSSAVFLSFGYRMPVACRARVAEVRVAEVRGRVLRLEFTDGVEQFVVDAPDSWEEGTQLETGFVEAVTKKDRPFLGVRFWRMVEGSDLEGSRILSDVPKAR